MKKIWLLGLLLLLTLLTFINPQALTNHTFLSDLCPIYAQAGWRELANDKVIDKNEMTTLNINHQMQKFKKSISIHADAEVVYRFDNLVAIKSFSAYFGLEATKGNQGDGIGYQLYLGTLKVDGNPQNKDDYDYTLKETITQINGLDEARLITLDVSGYQALKIIVDKKGNMNFDHAVLGHPVFYQEGYSMPLFITHDFIKEESYYAEQVKALTNYENITAYENILLKYYFVKVFKYDQLQAFANCGTEQLAFLKWFFNSSANLKNYFMGGRPDNNNWLKALNNYFELWQNYQADFLLTTPDPVSNVPLGLIYQKMAIALSLVYAEQVPDWFGALGMGKTASNHLKRYQIYKEMHNEVAPNNENNHPLLDKEIFDNLPIEYLRWVFNTQMQDKEIKWLNYHARKKRKFDGSFSIGGYDHLQYTDGNAHVNYFNKNKLNEPTNPAVINLYNQMDSVYELSRFGITNDGQMHTWVPVHTGQVCGGISKHGASMLAACGYPAVVIGQPGHGAYLAYYRKNKTEAVKWQIHNNISNWPQSEKGERQPLSWRGKKFSDDYNTHWVMVSAQALVEEFDKTYQSKLLNILYTIQTDASQKVALLNYGLTYQPINFTFYEHYLALDKAIVQNNINFLLTQIMQGLKNYPQAVFDLLQSLRKYLEHSYSMRYLIDYQLATYLKTTTIPSFLYQSDNQGNLLYLKNKSQPWFFKLDLALGKLIINPAYYRVDENKLYIALDAAPWQEITPTHEDSELFYPLTNDFIAKLQLKTKVKLRYGDDLPVEEFEIARADTSLIDVIFHPSSNTLSGNLTPLRWSVDNKSFYPFTSDFMPNLNAIEEIYLCYYRFQHYLDSEVICLPLNNKDPEVNNLLALTYYGMEVSAVSSEETKKANHHAKNIIDNNHKTIWHTQWNIHDHEKMIMLKLGQTYPVKRLVYTPRILSGANHYQNGTFMEFSIYGSQTGDSFTPILLNLKRPLANTDWVIDFPNASLVSYIKIICHKAYDNGGNNRFASGAMITLLASREAMQSNGFREFNFCVDQKQQIIKRKYIIPINTDVTSILTTIDLAPFTPAGYSFDKWIATTKDNAVYYYPLFLKNTSPAPSPDPTPNPNPAPKPNPTPSPDPIPLPGPKSKNARLTIALVVTGSVLGVISVVTITLILVKNKKHGPSTVIEEENNKD